MAESRFQPNSCKIMCKIYLKGGDMSDKQKIRKWFKTRKYLTCWQAVHKLGVYNLRSRVSEMQDVVSDGLVEVVRKDGVLTRVARYKLKG